MKRIICLMLSVLMLAGLFTGCVGNEQNPNLGQGEPLGDYDVVDAHYPIVENPITVKVLTVKNTRGLDDSRLVWDEVAKLTNISVEWIEVDSEALGTYLSANAKNWEWDFVHMGDTYWQDIWTLDFGIEGGLLVDYRNYLQYMPNLLKAYEDYPTAKPMTTETNGAIYRLPRIEVSATMTQVRPYIDTAALAQYNIKVPTTIDELYDALKTWKQKTGNYGWIPANLQENQYNGPTIYGAFGTATTADWDTDANGNVVYNRTSEQYKRYLEFMNKLYKEDLIDQEYLTVDANYTKAAAKAHTSFFWGGEAHSMAPSDWTDGQVHIGCLEPLTSEYDSTKTYQAQNPVALSTFFINAKSKYVVEICKMLDIMFAATPIAGTDGLCGQSFIYGREGKDYVMNSDKTYDQVTPADWTGTYTDYQYDVLINTVAGRADRLDGYVTGTPGNGQARQIAFRDSVFPYVVDLEEQFPEAALKFTADEQDDLAQMYTEITSYVNEMKAAFITGTKDINTDWDAYIQGLYNRGLSDVMEIYQTAYDRWLDLLG